MMADLGIAEIRAEGRRLLAAAGRGGHSELTDLEVFMVDNAVVLLADPGPVGLTEDEQVTVDWLRDSGDPWDRRVLAMTDRLTGSRAVTVPVPLTDIEAAAGEATPGPWTTPDVSAVWGGDGWVLTDASYEDAAHIATADPPTVLALCEALRIAVGALDVYLADDGNDTIPPDVAGRALAAVRELVDLGGDK